LAYAAQRLQMQRQVGPPHRYLYPASRPRQGLHCIAAQEPRAAEDCDNGRISQCDRHGGPVYLKHRVRIESLTHNPPLREWKAVASLKLRNLRWGSAKWPRVN